MSKVRAKMQEFDQGQGWSGSQNPPPEQLPQSSSASYYPSYAPSQQQGSGQGVYAQPPNPQRQTSQSQPTWTNTYQLSPPRSGVLRRAATEPTQPATPQQSSYYDPNAQGYDLYGDDEDIQIIDKTTPTLAAAASSTAQTPVTPPRADSPATPLPSSGMSSPPSFISPASPPPSSRLSSTSPPGAKGTASGTPGGVDFSVYTLSFPRFPRFH